MAREGAPTLAAVWKGAQPTGAENMIFSLLISITWRSKRETLIGKYRKHSNAMLRFSCLFLSLTDKGLVTPYTDKQKPKQPESTALWSHDRPPGPHWPGPEPGYRGLSTQPEGGMESQNFSSIFSQNSSPQASAPAGQMDSKLLLLSWIKLP